MEMEKELEAYRRHLELRNFSPSTITVLYYLVRRYMAFCAARGSNPSEAREEDLMEYLAELRAQNMRPVCIRKTFSGISGYFKWLQRQNRITQNPIPALQEVYLREYKPDNRQRQIISIQDAARMISATMRVRDRAILYLLFTTGIRRNELVTLDVEDVDFEKMEVHLKPTAKRSNKTVFLTPECARTIKKWLKVREGMRTKSPALFISSKNLRLSPSGVDVKVAEAGERVGLHDSKSLRLEDKFTPHCCRHWLVTHLLRAGMRREYVKWLRGDVMKEAIDIYFHIDPEDVRKEYLAYVPQLGV